MLMRLTSDKILGTLQNMAKDEGFYYGGLLAVVREIYPRDEQKLWTHKEWASAILRVRDDLRNTIVPRQQSNEDLPFALLLLTPEKEKLTDVPPRMTDGLKKAAKPIAPRTSLNASLKWSHPVHSWRIFYATNPFKYVKHVCRIQQVIHCPHVAPNDTPAYRAVILETYLLLFLWRRGSMSLQNAIRQRVRSVQNRWFSESSPWNPRNKRTKKFPPSSTYIVEGFQTTFENPELRVLRELSKSPFDAWKSLRNLVEQADASAEHPFFWTFEKEFEKEIEEAPCDVGRADVLEALDAFIRQPGHRSIFALAGGPGTGKSTLMLTFLKRQAGRGHLFPKFLIRFNEGDRDSPVRILTDLAIQVEPTLGKDPAIRMPVRDGEAVELMNRALRTVSRQKGRLFIAIDGLDETEPPPQPGSQSLSALLRRLTTPDNVHWILSSRNTQEFRALAGKANITLEDSELQQQAIREYYRRVLPRSILQKLDLARLVSLTDSSFLYAELAASEVFRTGCLDLKDAPYGLAERLEKERLRIERGPLPIASATRILGTLAIHQRKPTLDEISRFSDTEPAEVLRFFAEHEHLFLMQPHTQHRPSAQVLGFKHAEIYRHLVKTLLQNEGLRRAHDRLVAAYVMHCPIHDWYTLPDDGYFFQHLGYHLFGAGRTEALINILTSSARWIDTQQLATGSQLCTLRDIALASASVSEKLTPQALRSQVKLRAVRSVVLMDNRKLSDSALQIMVWLGKAGIALNYARSRPLPEERLGSLCAVLQALYDFGEEGQELVDEILLLARGLDSSNPTQRKMLARLAAELRRQNKTNSLQALTADHGSFSKITAELTEWTYDMHISLAHRAIAMRQYVDALALTRQIDARHRGELLARIIQTTGNSKDSEAFRLAIDDLIEYLNDNRMHPAGNWLWNCVFRQVLFYLGRSHNVACAIDMALRVRLPSSVEIPKAKVLDAQEAGEDYCQAIITAVGQLDEHVGRARLLAVLGFACAAADCCRSSRTAIQSALRDMDGLPKEVKSEVVAQLCDAAGILSDVLLLDSLLDKVDSDSERVTICLGVSNIALCAGHRALVQHIANRFCSETTQDHEHDREIAIFQAYLGKFDEAAEQSRKADKRFDERLPDAALLSFGLDGALKMLAKLPDPGMRSEYILRLAKTGYQIELRSRVAMVLKLLEANTEDEELSRLLMGSAMTLVYIGYSEQAIWLAGQCSNPHDRVRALAAIAECLLDVSEVERAQRLCSEILANIQTWYSEKSAALSWMREKCGIAALLRALGNREYADNLIRAWASEASTLPREADAQQALLLLSFYWAISDSDLVIWEHFRSGDLWSTYSALMRIAKFFAFSRVVPRIMAGDLRKLSPYYDGSFSFFAAVVEELTAGANDVGAEAEVPPPTIRFEKVLTEAIDVLGKALQDEVDGSESDMIYGALCWLERLREVTKSRTPENFPETDHSLIWMYYVVMALGSRERIVKLARMVRLEEHSWHRRHWRSMQDIVSRGNVKRVVEASEYVGLQELIWLLGFGASNWESVDKGLFMDLVGDGARISGWRLPNAKAFSAMVDEVKQAMIRPQPP